MKMRLALIASSAIAAASSFAQPAPPDGPLLNHPPDSTTWTITTTLTQRSAPGSGGSSSAPDDPKAAPQTKTVGEKAGDLSHTKTTGPGAPTVETLTKGDLQAISNSEWPEPQVSPTSADRFYEDLQWVSAETFKGVKDESGRQVLVFEKVIEGGGGGDANLRPDIYLSAKVDAQTRLPVQSRSESKPFGTDKLCVYEFRPMQSGETVPVPANLAALLKSAEEKAEQNAGTAERP